MLKASPYADLRLWNFKSAEYAPLEESHYSIPVTMETIGVFGLKAYDPSSEISGIALLIYHTGPPLQSSSQVENVRHSNEEQCMLPKHVGPGFTGNLQVH